MKGQLFSIDIMVAMGLFFIVLAMIFYIWTTIQDPRIKDVQERALSVSEFLVSSRIGKESILDCYKTYLLANKSTNNSADYSAVKTELSVGQFDLFVEFKNTSANTSAICSGNQTNIGVNLTNTTNVASIVRFVSLDNQKMQMIVRLYA